MQLQDFDYELPDALIAQVPARERRESRLLHLDGCSGLLSDGAFSDLPHHCRPGDVLVLNDTRVVKARLFGRKASGGRVEILIERVLDHGRALAQIRASHAPKAGSFIYLDCGARVHVTARHEEFHELAVEGNEGVAEIMARHGSLPLPPYIAHVPEVHDEERYQTVYAERPGAVAAPTAGLHFDRAMLNHLQNSGVEIVMLTLHVGAGTFQPVRVTDVADHRMHSERYEIPVETAAAVNAARREGRRVMAVGTTSLRALESAVTGGKLREGSGETRLFITPGYRFAVVDRLLTNFHLPKSTLLMLVSAFGGVDNIRRAYAHAVARRYRFFSYGDAMLIEKRSD
jgi:S-adenosylmethionine:tRNA ribosyltransferase-isomerase